MKQFKRDIEKLIAELSKSYSAILVTGPRQVGKTTALLNLKEKERGYVTLDDIVERRLAKTDPRMFLQMHPTPVIIDEIQYAPELFSFIKIAIDLGAAPGSFWLTGSQSFSMMSLAQESLAGRVALLHMSSLTQQEIFSTGESSEFKVDIKYFQRRQNLVKETSVAEIFERIFRGGMPAYLSGKYSNREIFFRSYLETYLGRDIRDFAPKTDLMLFSDFIRAAACRCGTLLNVADIARDVNVSVPTAHHWLKLLERSDIIYFLHPFSNNLLKRTVKAPKMYFFDTGLVAYLARYPTAETLANGAINGNILENYVINQIRMSFLNQGKDAAIFYYRDFDQVEVDVLLQDGGEIHPIEIKKTTMPTGSAVKGFAKLKKSSLTVGKGALICNAPNLGAINSDTFIVPIGLL